MDLHLPPALAALDLGDRLEADPSDLRSMPPPWVRHPAADRALRYGRRHGGLPYDEIAERTQAALPRRPVTSIYTRGRTRLERRRDTSHRRNADIDSLIEQIETLRHRPLELPQSDLSNYRLDAGEEHLVVYSPNRTGGEDAWYFSLAHPPRMFLRSTYDADPALIATQGYRVDFPGVFWLPLGVVLDRGEFPRFQEGRDVLAQATQPGCFYVFVSHRWLATDEPDPEAEQARFFVWQYVAYLCEALEIARDRGLHTPRQASTVLRRPVGRFGSELAESLLINLLRPTLDEQRLATAISESAGFGEQLADLGFAAAQNDSELRQLRDMLGRMPVIRELLGRIFLWYDYSCLPQCPRNSEDETLFRQGLAHLNQIQVMSVTAVLLDDVEDYLGRAWCVLETVAAKDFAAAYGGEWPFILATSRRSTNRGGRSEEYHAMLLEDLPHLVWRALLDTEVFKIQSPERCMERLQLSVTDPADQPFVYQELLRYRAPGPMTDDSEVVTGLFSLPFADDGSSVYWRTLTTTNIVDAVSPEAVLTLDWTPAVHLHSSIDRERDDLPLNVPPMRSLLADQDALLSSEALEGMHLAVVGGCEGEAVLIADWTHRRRRELEESLGMRAVSISWIATDIAPVGWMPCGFLLPCPILTPYWVVIATQSRLGGCEVTGHLLEMLRTLGRPHAEFGVDRPKDNLRRYSRRELRAGLPGIVTYRITEKSLRRHRGGLFRGALLNYLLPVSERIPS